MWFSLINHGEKEPCVKLMKGENSTMVGLQSFSDKMIHNFMYEKSREGHWDFSTSWVLLCPHNQHKLNMIYTAIKALGQRHFNAEDYRKRKGNF